jgi:trans-aconitate methyltransferase
VYDDWFLEQRPPASTDHVIDAGCGSGEFTALLAGLVPDGHVTGVDPDASMLEAAARHRADNLEFRQGRIQDLDRVCDPGSADLVVSRAVFHWIPFADYLRCYRAIFTVLRPGGWLHAESGGAGNVRHFRPLLNEVATDLGLQTETVTFPDAGSVLELLEQAGFDAPPSGVTTVAQRRPFDREQLLDWVRTQAYVAYGVDPSDDLHGQFVAAVDDRLDEARRHDGTYDQTFVRLHVLACRPPKDPS